MNIIKATLIVVMLLSTSFAAPAQGDIVATGRFHGAAHKTTGRATIYSVNGKQTLVSPASRLPTARTFT
jgi:hypothetical protein